MNLYLSPNDVWTGAVVPFSSGARLIGTDRSCTEPRFAATVAPGELPFIDFRNDAFSGANDDSAGTGLDRTREGFVEILEMGTLAGASAAAVTHNSAGVPFNCAAVAGWTPTVEAPRGGLSGTLTLINVASGVDFNLNAEALDQLASRAYYRAPSDPYPDFNAAEIDAVSVVSADGSVWRSAWDAPVDAVSATLMRERVFAEYVLDQATASLTDVVMTLPTRHFHANGVASAAPFTRPARWDASCGTGSAPLGEPLSIVPTNREEARASTSGAGFPEPPPLDPVPAICAASAVFTVRNNALRQFSGMSLASTPVLGSITRGAGNGPGVVNTVPSTTFTNGWLDVQSIGTATLVSRAQSVRIDANGNSTAGAHAYKGLPVVGFSARILRNGALRCDAGTCLGNYGGAFPLKYRRNIAPAS